MKKVLVGGVFSIVHAGHGFFLKKAKSLGDFLIVVVASDRTAVKKNGVLPDTAQERKEAIEKLGIADRVVIGDSENQFKVIEKERPDIIALGYDQEINSELKKMIEGSGLRCEIVRIKEKFKDYSSSRIRKK